MVIVALLLSIGFLYIITEPWWAKVRRCLSEPEPEPRCFCGKMSFTGQRRYFHILGTIHTQRLCAPAAEMIWEPKSIEDNDRSSFGEP